MWPAAAAIPVVAPLPRSSGGSSVQLGARSDDDIDWPGAAAVSPLEDEPQLLPGLASRAVT